MKKITLALLLLSSTILFAQAPQKMNYQSVIRKTDGALLVNTSIGIKTSILLGSSTGTASYVETQTTTTNVNGLATIEIGGGTPVTGTFSGIDWGAGSHFIKTEIDPAGGTNYTISGTSQLLSVPYALYAGSSASKGKTTIMLTGDITDVQAATQIQAEYGPYTENIYIMGTTNLTTVDLSMVKKIIDLNVSDNLNLTTVNFSNLSEIYKDLKIMGNEKLGSVSFPALKISYSGDTNISRNSSLTSISFPLLTKSIELYFTNNPVLTSIDVPLLTFVNNNEGVTFRNNALSSTQINLILSRLKKLTSKGNYIQLDGQTPAAPPTGQGIADKAFLVNRGDILTTD
ncbi:hypothetical protein [Flavobacterium chungbukense]|uniref:Uncharacterized protein n=1 Tax=Flavobacterium chungbukense TaxID=877464 RepID=A0ABP7XQE0_9FLAO|nr:hypothetical protein [Flavobacterium chungbukense]MCC4920971.1 hypothetical protein [Flavobacterium chungbukense]